MPLPRSRGAALATCARAKPAARPTPSLDRLPLPAAAARCKAAACDGRRQALARVPRGQVQHRGPAGYVPGRAVASPLGRRRAAEARQPPPGGAAAAADDDDDDDERRRRAALSDDDEFGGEEAGDGAAAEEGLTARRRHARARPRRDAAVREGGREHGPDGGGVRDRAVQHAGGAERGPLRRVVQLRGTARTTTSTTWLKETDGATAESDEKVQKRRDLPRRQRATQDEFAAPAADLPTLRRALVALLQPGESTARALKRLAAPTAARAAPKPRVKARAREDEERRRWRPRRRRRRRPTRRPRRRRRVGRPTLRR